MRYSVAVLFLLMVFVSCKREQRMVNIMEGKWQYTKLLQNDGSYAYFSSIIEFQGGDVDGVNELPLRFYDSDTTDGWYKVNKKASEVEITFDAANTPAKIYKIEDKDKNSLVLRTDIGVLFLDKID